MAEIWDVTVTSDNPLTYCPEFETLEVLDSSPFAAHSLILELGGLDSSHPTKLVYSFR